MTKTLKGQPARSFSTSTTDEFISARNVFLTQPVDRLGDSGRLGAQRDGSSSALDGGNVGRTAFLTQPIEQLTETGRFGLGDLERGTATFEVKEAPAFCMCGLCAPGKSAGDSDGATETNVTHLVPPTIADEGTQVVTVGGSVSGVIDFTGDEDTITVNLVSGQTYMITLRGTGATPVTDTFLTVNAPGGALVNTDDDGGTGTFSTITFTAGSTGTYTITAESFSNPGDPGLGEWTVDVRQRGADNVPGTIPSAVVHTIGSTTFNFIETSGDADVYQVNLTAGFVYSFEVAAGADYNTDYLAVPAGEVDTLIDIFDSNGVLIGTVDDIAFPDDISSAISILPETSGTFYVRVRGYSGQTGGYTLISSEQSLGSLDPLDAINWFSADNVDFTPVVGVPTAYVYFALPGENFGELGDDGVTPAPSLGWTVQQQTQLMTALEQYEHILGVNYEITTNVAQATFRIFTTTSQDFGAYFYPQDPAYGTQQGVGAFNTLSGGFTTPASLDQGGYSFAVILHEFGHAHGLAHPHDNGGGSDVLLGVTAATGSYGVYDLNQGVYTVMSYNDAWDLHPDGPQPFNATTVGYGWSGSLSAFDIAVLQLRYGVHDFNVGNNTYLIDDADAVGTFYECIWDSAGTDEISYTGVRNATIDLTAATLDYSPTGGGVLSFVRNVHGGFTIANGVVIENATSGNGNDVLIGNSAANILTANGGADILIGREGDDVMYGGSGTDTAIFSGNIADYTITAIVGGFTIEDNNTGDGDDGFDTFYDGEIAQFDDGNVTLGGGGPNVAPTLTGLVASLTFNENTVNATPQVIDSDVDFQDANGNFNGGSVVVSGLLAEDRVAIRNEGSGAGQIGVSGANVSYGGIVIGTIAGGVGNTLTVTLNAFATSVAVDALLQNLTYANVSHTPSLLRTLSINVIDADGADVFEPLAYSELTGVNNPFRSPAVLPAFAAGPTMAFVDVDSDGDLDIVMGDQPGTLRYFRNNGGGTYTELTGAGNNPFNGFDPGSYTSPVNIDVDGDGDQDLVVGANTGALFTFRNNGAGSWTQLIGAGVNPFNGVVFGSFTDTASGDIDNDGDMDLIVSNSAGGVTVFRHNADHTFTQLTGAGVNPFNGVNPGTFATVTAGDIDNDGDVDVVFGNSAGTLLTYLNNGNGTFTNQVGAANPFNTLDFGSFTFATLVDVDNDGDLDIAVSDGAGGDFRTYQNTVVRPNVDIRVNAQNDAPSGTNITVSFYEIPFDGWLFTAANFGFSDLDGNAFAGVVISTLPNQGTLFYDADGPAGAAPVAATAGLFVSAAIIAAGGLTFLADAGESGTGYATFTFAVRDNGGTANGGQDTDQTPNTFTFNVLPANTPPTLRDLVDEVTYDENVVNVTPQLLDIDVDFRDTEGNFNFGTVMVSGLLAEDRVAINNEGVGAGQIGISGTNVTYGGVNIGSFNGGVGNTLTVTLNAAATSAAVDALIENLTYANVEDQPTATRTLTLQVTDAAGATLDFPATFEQLAGGDNPFDGIVLGAGTYPTFLDVDGDSDIDMIAGDEYGALYYFQNDGGVFTEQTGVDNPFDGVVVGSYSTPTAIDLDGDGDLDLVVGSNYGDFYSFRNDGGGTFTQLVGAADPFAGVDVGSFSAAAAGDLDGDGDMELVVGNSAGQIATFNNNGNGTFTQLTGTANPFNGIDVGNFANPSLIDIDGDGDLDALVGEYFGGIYAFVNGGGAMTPTADNPMAGLSPGPTPALAYVDLDGDGDLDAVAGSFYGDFYAYQNTATDGTIEVNVTAQVDIVELYDGGGVLVDTFSTIQLAIDSASDGYRIVAPAGTYNEDLVVDVDVTIQGANVGVAGTGTRVAETIITGSVNVTANGVTIDGVEITGDAPDAGFHVGVNVHGNGFSLVNSVLSGRDGDFVDDTVAVLAGAVTGLDIGDNLITGYLRGVYLFSAVTAGSVHDNTFQGAGSPNPTFEGMGNGIVIETQLVTIDGNTFDGIWAGVVNVGPTGSNPADLATYILNNIYNDVSDRPIQVYPTNDVHEIFGTDENEAFSGDLAVSDNGVTSASFTFHGRGGDDHIYGDAQGDFFYGDDGNDRIFAAGGNDDMTGGAGSDLLQGGAGIDTARFAGALNFVDTIVGWVASSADGNDFLDGVEIAIAGSGQRHLLVGSTAFATIQAASDAAQTGDYIRLASGTYGGTVNYSVGGLTVVAQPGAVQNLTYSTAGSFGITIYGAGAVDHITTGAGNDYIDAKGGADVMAGGAGDDVYIVDNAGDVVNEAASQGTDRVYVVSGSYTLTAGSHVEIMQAGGPSNIAAINMTGNELVNNIWDNGGGNHLFGMGGNDAIFGFAGNDYLDGGTGTDFLVGGLGDDVFVVDNAGDLVIETAGEGSDRVYALVDYTLGASVEVEVLAAGGPNPTAAINLTGNELDNNLWGNEGSNLLNGTTGNDTLFGFGGADNLFGGEGDDFLIGGNGDDALFGTQGNDLLLGQAGVDSFVFNSPLGAGNVDTIGDFEAGVDRIGLDDSVFGLPMGALSDDAFVVGTAALDADDRIIYDTATGTLYFDADGNGAGAAVAFAILADVPVITASDFTIF